MLKNKLQLHYQSKICEQLNNIHLVKADSGKLSFYNEIVNQNENEPHYLKLPFKKMRQICPNKTVHYLLKLVDILNLLLQ